MFWVIDDKTLEKIRYLSDQGKELAQDIVKRDVHVDYSLNRDTMIIDVDRNRLTCCNRVILSDGRFSKILCRDSDNHYA